MAQDMSLSRTKYGFDSRWDYKIKKPQLLLRFWLSSTNSLNFWQINTQDPKYRQALAKAYQEELAEYKAGRWGKGEPPPEPGYLRFRKSMELARQFQPYDPPYGPSNPDKPFGRDIRLEVIKLFEEFVFKRKAAPEERRRFQFFTGADKYNDGRNERRSDSPIDAHGVDAWLEYTDENGETFIATFDLTRRRVVEKNKSGRDVMVQEQELGDPHLEPEKYEASVEKLAQQAIRKMLHRQLLEKKIVL